MSANDGQLWRAGLLVAAATLVPVSTLADPPKSSRLVYPLTKKGPASELPVVKKVGGSRVTVGKKTYEVTEFTKITVDGKRAEVTDLRRGMQASVTGGVLRYGRTKSDTVYKATRIAARADNQLEKKRKEFNKKQLERARKLQRRRHQYQNRR